MFWHWKKPIIISRDELRVLVSHQLGNQDFVPLEAKYMLVPDYKWLLRRTPVFPKWLKDCNKRALLTASKMLRHCVGMCVVETNDPMVDHALLLVCMSGRKLMVYDPASLALNDTSKFKVKRIWI